LEYATIGGNMQYIFNYIFTFVINSYDFLTIIHITVPACS
jgi:hypothetical protein